MSIHEIHGDGYEIGQAVFVFLTHTAYLRVNDTERADEIAEQVMAEQVPRIGPRGFTAGAATQMLRRVKELSEGDPHGQAG